MRMIRLMGAAVLSLAVGALPALASNGRGMTWAATNHGTVPGVDLVGCSKNSMYCDPYVGDTSCSASLPILCLKTDNSPVPPGLSPDFHHGWARGNIATTQPIPGTWLYSPAAADQICVNYFGAGWRMAEFHDGGGGWSFYVYGNVRTDTSLWVRISDQPANCWN